jgi:hypothetical protein
MKTVSIHKGLTIKLIVVAFLMAFSSSLFAQRQDRATRMERIKAQRIAFLSEKMSLTTDEAQKLWPVLNEFHQKRQELMNEYRRRWPRDLDVSKLSEKEAEQYAEYQVLHIERSAKLARELHEELKKILPSKKIALLYEAEEEFNRKLVQERIQRARE